MSAVSVACPRWARCRQSLWSRLTSRNRLGKCSIRCSIRSPSRKRKRRIRSSPQSHGDTEKHKVKGETRAHRGGGGHGGLRPPGFSGLSCGSGLTWRKLTAHTAELYHKLHAKLVQRSCSSSFPRSEERRVGKEWRYR